MSQKRVPNRCNEVGKSNLRQPETKSLKPCKSATYLKTGECTHNPKVGVRIPPPATSKSFRICGPFSIFPVREIRTKTGFDMGTTPGYQNAARKLTALGRKWERRSGRPGPCLLQRWRWAGFCCPWARPTDPARRRLIPPRRTPPGAQPCRESPDLLRTTASSPIRSRCAARVGPCPRRKRGRRQIGARPENVSGTADSGPTLRSGGCAGSLSLRADTGFRLFSSPRDEPIETGKS